MSGPLAQSIREAKTFTLAVNLVVSAADDEAYDQPSRSPIKGRPFIVRELVRVLNPQAYQAQFSKSAAW